MLLLIGRSTAENGTESLGFYQGDNQLLLHVTTKLTLQMSRMRVSCYVPPASIAIVDATIRSLLKSAPSARDARTQNGEERNCSEIFAALQSISKVLAARSKEWRIEDVPGDLPCTSLSSAANSVTALLPARKLR